MLRDLIDSARERIREMKKYTPWMLTEYTNMIHAKSRYLEAKKNYKKAKKIWEKLGE